MSGERELAVDTAPSPCADVAGKPRRARAADKVTEAANRLFYERGIRAVGVEEIVATAGVTKPSLYRRYSSKDALVAACLETRFAEAIAWIDRIDGEHPGDAMGAFRAIVAHVADEMREAGYRGCALTNAAVEFVEPDHPTRVLAIELKTRKKERMREIARRLPTDRPDALVDALILLLEGARAISHISGGTCCGPAASLTIAADAVLAGFTRGDQAIPSPRT